MLNSPFTFFLKKTFILLLVFYSFSVAVFSQDVYSNKESATISFTLGLTSSDMYHDTINYTPGILFNGGFVYTLTLSDKLNAGIELLYTGKSVRKEHPIIKYRFSYVELPLYIQYKFSEGIKANIGFQYSKYVNAHYLFLDGSKSNGLHKKPYSSSLGDDYGVLFGAEFKISNDLEIEARYSLSLNSFMDKGNPYFGVFQLSFKYIAYRSYKQYFHKKEIEKQL